jgi:ATP-dependent RNA helicase DDX54/DBP10
MSNTKKNNTESAGLSTSNADLLNNFEEDNFSDDEEHKHDKIRAQFGSKNKKVKGGSFESFNLSNEVFRAIKKKGYNMPTPI